MSTVVDEMSSAISGPRIKSPEILSNIIFVRESFTSLINRQYGEEVSRGIKELKERKHTTIKLCPLKFLCRCRAMYERKLFEGKNPLVPDVI